MGDLSFKTEVEDSSVYSFEERYQPDVIAFEKDWDFERSSGYAGYRNKHTSEWIYDSEYRNRTRKLKNSINADASITSCVVEWEAQFELREWGIKSISVAIKKVTAIVSWSVDIEGMTEEQKQPYFKLGGTENERKGIIEGEIELDSDKEIDGNKWEIKSSVGVHDSSIYPNSIEVDLKKMTIEIE